MLADGLRMADFPHSVEYNLLATPRMRGQTVFNFGEAEIKRLLVNILMVAGGYVVGYLLGMLVAIGFDKLVFRRKSPEGLHKVVRAIFGALLAVLVALVVFRGGGGGVGDGTGPGTNPESTTGGQNSSTTTDPGPATSEPVHTSANVAVEVIRVKVLAGDEVEKGTSRFYLLGESSTRVERSTVLDAISERKKKSTKTLVVVYKFGQEAGTGTIAYAELATELKNAGIQMLSEAEYQNISKR
jgi:hypothetical protein